MPQGTSCSKRRSQPSRHYEPVGVFHRHGAVRSGDGGYRAAAEIANKNPPVEVVDACIARIERRNPSLNALIFYGFDDARRKAKAAEEAMRLRSRTGPVRDRRGHRRRRLDPDSSPLGTT
jgi:hypothetical protein